MPVRRFGQQKCEQIAQPVGAEHLRHPFGHDGQRRMMQILDIVTRHNVDFAVLIADQQLVILRANRSRQNPPAFEQHDGREEIGIDREAGQRHVAEQGGIVTMAEIRQVRPDRTARCVRDVTLGTTRFVAAA